MKCYRKSPPAFLVQAKAFTMLWCRTVKHVADRDILMDAILLDSRSQTDFVRASAMRSMRANFTCFAVDWDVNF